MCESRLDKGNGVYLVLLRRLCLAILLISSVAFPVYAVSKAQEYYQKGVNALAKGELLESEKWFILAYRSDSEAHTGYEELLVIYDMQQRYEKGLELINSEIAHQGEKAKLLLAKGLALVRLKRIDEAQQYYLKAGSLKPTDPNVLFAIEQYLTNAGKMEQAQGYATRREALGE